MDIKIIVATHKKYRMPESDMYVPLQLGAKDKEFIGYKRDDEGDNISYKNDTYCELTGLYFAWKNIDCDYLGLVHYRRYFTSPKSNLLNPKELATIPNPFTKKEDTFDRILTRTEAEDILSDYDMIVPGKRHYYIETLYSHYDHTFDGRHLRVAYKIIARYYPEYLRHINKVYRRKWGYMFNMFIADKKLVSEYCEWLFNILGILEKNVDTSEYDAFEKRLFGRVSEILFNVWLDYQISLGLRIKEVRCIHMEPINWLKKGMSFLNAKFLNKKYNKSF